MSTKFYLLNKNTELDYFNGGSSWTNNGWNNSGGFTYYGTLIDPIKMGNPSSAFSLSDNGTFFTPPDYHLLYRGISRKLMPQILSGTIDAVFYCGQSTAAANCYTRLFVYVVDTTGNPFTPVFKSYLVNNYQETLAGGGVEWPISNVNTINSRRLLAPVSITSYTIPSDGRDYRIIVELGCKADFTAGQSFASNTRVGGRGVDYAELPDLIVSPTFVLGAPYIEFSADITLKTLNYPVNHEPEFATDIGAGPITSNPVGHSLSEHFLWYKYSQNKTVNRSISVLFCSPGTPGDNYANLFTFSGLSSGIDGPPFYVGAVSAGTNGKRPVMVATKANCNAYFKTYLSGFGSNTATLSVVESPNSVQAGDLLVNCDDSGPNLYDPTMYASSPSVWWNPNTGQVSLASATIPYSELGVTLETGRFAIPTQQAPYELFIFDKVPSLVLLHRVPLPGYPPSIGTDFKSFYVAIGSNSYSSPPTIFKVNEDGTMGSKSWVLTVPAGDQIKNFAVSRDSSIAYIKDNTSGNIHRHNLVTDLPMSPILMPTGNEVVDDILVMSNGTIVTTIDTSPTRSVIHFAANGTILHTWPMITGYNTDHIIHDGSDSPDKIWIWLQRGSPNPRWKFALINIITGATVKQFDTDDFSISSGAGQYDPGCNPSTRFGVGSSCAFLSMMVPKVPPDISGIYFINPTKVNKHDSYQGDIEKKIPNPTVKTALIGE